MKTFVTRSFPHTRLRRNRRHDWSRRLVRETNLTVDNLIWPIFIRDEKPHEAEINSLPGVKRLTIPEAVAAADQAQKIGIPLIALFPVTDPKLKNPQGSEALNPDNLVCRCIRAIKAKVPEIGIMADVALDPYTSHGHDGILANDYVENDITIEALCQQSLVQAKAGADVIAPSDMMDGRVAAIRKTLDECGLCQISILSYAAKYASVFYGPFRDAVASNGCLGKGNKKTYQMDPANVSEALHEVSLDIQEGADMVMVKPGLPYLDIVAKVKDTFDIPTFVYQVSGEYSSIVAAAERGWLDRRQAVLETLLAFRRAGADGILSYFAMEAAHYLKEDQR